MNQTGLFPERAPTQDAGPRRWVPDRYVDEMSPSPRAAPEDWLIRLDDGAIALAGGGDDEEDDPRQGCARLSPGEIVPFMWTQHFGTVEMTIRPDGGYDLHQQPHPDATMFHAVGDGESMADSLEEFARNYADPGLDDRGERIEVFCYAWSERSTNFRLVVDASATLGARFDLVKMEPTLATTAGLCPAGRADAGAGLAGSEAEG